MSSWNWKWPWVWLPALLLLAACQTSPEPGLEPQALTDLNVTLDRERAAPGEAVRAELTGLAADAPAPKLDGLEVSVVGLEAPVQTVEALAFEFVVPEGAPPGPQPVEVRLAGQTLLAELIVLAGEGGDGPPDPPVSDDALLDLLSSELTLVVEPGTTVDALTSLLAPLVFTVMEGPRPLGLAEGPCSGELLRIQVDGIDLGGRLGDILDIGDIDLGDLVGIDLSGVLDILLGQAEGPVWYSDPESGYDSGTVDSLAEIGALQATDDSNNQGGAGTVIGVLDTGVSAHEELGSRLLSGAGYDFVDEDADASDGYGDGGHGTPIAVLAAGSSVGVAPQAQILPVRVCDESGTCYTSDVTLGLCHALTAAENELGGMENLVLNLSLGGETPNTAIEAILDFALENGTLVAASGGNQGQEGSPPHYPAAYDMDGVVATAALEANGQGNGQGGWRPASFSTRGDYLDIAAPGVDLESGSASGGYAADYTGTSYATALTAGALALWREANPGMSPADVETDLKASAGELRYPDDLVGAGMLELPE